MHSSRGSSPALRAALAAALLTAAALGHPAALHPQPDQRAGGRVPTRSLARPAAVRVPEPASPLPEPFGLALLSMLAAATVGACVVDLAVPDGRRLSWWRRGADGWVLRLLGKLVVGSAAAAVLFAVNPVEGWWRTGVTALLGGVGGEALLLTVVATRKAHQAEQERDMARRETRRLARAGARRVEELRSLAVRLHRRARAQVQPPAAGEGAPRTSPFELVINSVAEHATAELVDDEDEERGIA